MEILLLFACVLALVVIDVPIAVALGLVAVAAMVATQGLASLPNLPVVLYNGATNFPLIAIPLFILAGAIMNASGISKRLIAFASAVLGFIRGGLAMVSIGASMFFAEISGSAVADVSALGSILIPAMKAKGYLKALAAAVMSSAATLAVIIPPSIPMILSAETAVVMLLVATSALLGSYLTETQAPQKLARAVSELTSNKWVVLALLNLLFLLLGMFLHSAAAIILVVPVVMPLVKAVGIDPVHFGLIVTVNLGIGQQTPPVASVLMVASSIAKESIWAVTRVNIWFIVVLLFVLLLVTYVPVSGLGLVQLFYR